MFTEAPRDIGGVFATLLADVFPLKKTFPRAVFFISIYNVKKSCKRDFFCVVDKIRKFGIL